VTISALSSEAEDALAKTFSEPAEAEASVEAAADVEPLPAEVAVDELDVVRLEQYSVTGVMRSAYSANVPSVHSEGAIDSSSESTDWQAVLVHMVAISASEGVASEVTV